MDGDNKKSHAATHGFFVWQGKRNGGPASNFSSEFFQ
jgi:hypothetical protein